MKNTGARNGWRARLSQPNGGKTACAVAKSARKTGGEQRKGLRAKSEAAAIAALLAGISILSACARQVAPGGGPLDKTPPSVLSTLPENRATRVPLDQSIQFIFSERMNRKTLEKAIFITPAPRKRTAYKWKGRKLRVDLGEPLRPNLTYVITLGTDLKDMHGNALTSSYTLAFSTGESISDGTIGGRIYDAEKPRGVLVWAYVLADSTPPNPATDLPDYVTQTDAGGAYELTHLSAATYRLFAVEDTDGDRVFTPNADGLGVPQSDIALGDSATVTNIEFRISKKDTLGPALTAVQAADRLHLAARFDEPIAPETAANPANYAILAGREKNADALSVRLAYVDPLDSSAVQLVTAQQTGGMDYSLTVRNVTDRSGNVVDPGFSSLNFSGTAIADTFRPKLGKTIPADKARAVPMTSSISFLFNEAIQMPIARRQIVVADSGGYPVTGRILSTGPASLQFVPEKHLRSLMRYSITARLDSLLDLAGNAAADSMLELTFTAINRDTLSSISGVVSDADSSARGRIFLQASLPGETPVTYRLTLEGPGPYHFMNILPGIYSIQGFRDEDGDGRYSYGRAVPFSPAERFIVYGDSIKVRARWPNEGNDFPLPSRQPGESGK